MDRANRIVSHLNASEVVSSNAFVTGNSTAAGPSPEDIVIVSAKRTPIGRAKKGSFKDTHPVELLAHALKAVVDDVKINPALVNDIVVGNVLYPGAFATQARQAGFLAGFPASTSLHSLNRQCSSGLQAAASVASAIRSGFYEIGIAAGVESMSLASMGGAVGDLCDKAFTNNDAKNCLLPMGQTSENVAEKYGITRDMQDQMAVESNAKAVAAQKAGHFKEIVPITVTVKDKEGKETSVTVTKDDGPRATSLEELAKLKPAFKKNGTTTAGNSSQMSDGAAAVLMMKRSTATKLGLKPIGSFKTFAVAGCPPEIMGIGPAIAIPAALKNAGLTLKDIDVFEINEAFASQATYCQKELGIPKEKINPNGGAIALGHPLGCTGARQIGSLLSELHRTNKKTGIVSMCIGTGMGAAGIIQAE